MNSKKPRIAFCFSWQARTLDKTFSYFQENLFNAAKEQWFEYDIFCVVEDDEDVDKINLLNPTLIEKIKSSDVEKKINIILNDVIIKNKKYFNSKYFNFLIETVPQQLYKIERSFFLKDQYKLEKNLQYDMVFRLRYDVIFNYKLKFSTLKDIFSQGCDIVCNSFWKWPNSYWSIMDLYFIANDSVKLDNLFSSYAYYYNKITSRKFVPIRIIYQILVFFLKILHKQLSNDIQDNISKKICYWNFVPEINLYKYLIGNKYRIKLLRLNIILIRKSVIRCYPKHKNIPYEIYL